MEKFTKEQTNLFTIIASVLMLIAVFFVKFKIMGMGGEAPINAIGNVGWFGTITLILAIIAPIYSCLYAFRDQKALEPLKPIFVVSPALAFAMPIIAFMLVLLGMCFGYFGWAMFLYALGAVAVYYIGQNSK